MPRGAGCGWLQLAWPVSLTVISGGKSHVAAAKTKIPGLLTGMGEEACKQTGSLCGPPKHVEVACCPRAARQFCARVDLGSSRCQPWAGAHPGSPGWGGRTALCPSTWEQGERGLVLVHSWDLSAWLWCPLLCQSLSTCYLCPPGCLLSRVLSGFRGCSHMGLRHQPEKQLSCLLWHSSRPASWAAPSKLPHVGLALALPLLAPLEFCNPPVMAPLRSPVA